MSEYIERETVIDEIESTTWYHINCQKNLVEGAAGEADALYKAIEPFHVRTFGNLLCDISVVGESIPCIVPDKQFGTLADSSVIQIGNDEESGFHPFTDSLFQPFNKHEEPGRGRNGYQVIMKLNNYDIRVDEHGYLPFRFQTAWRVHKHNLNFWIIVQLLHKGSHHRFVIGFVCPYLVWHFLFTVFSDVSLTAFHDGVMEVTVYHHNPCTFCHQIVGKGDAKGSLSHTSLLIGECHYNRSLYHFKY